MKRSALSVLALLVLSVSAFAGGSHTSSHHSTAPHSHHYSTARQTHRAYYTNRSGHRVHTPVQARSTPAAATARCRDGSYSFSEHHSGTCSHHGGVSTWFAH